MFAFDQELNKLINDAYQDGKPSESDPIWQSLQQKQAQHQAQIKEQQADDAADVRHFSRQLEVVKEAIESLIPHVTGLHIDRTSGKAELKVDNVGNTVNIKQHSNKSYCPDTLIRRFIFWPSRLKPLQSGKFYPSALAF